MQVFHLSGFCNKDIAAKLTRTYSRVPINQIPADQQAKTLTSYDRAKISFYKEITGQAEYGLFFRLRKPTVETNIKRKTVILVKNLSQERHV